jgi:dephospho-CoA kinase
MSALLNIVALTGGIATGKSTACRLILEHLPETVIFDADASVARLYDSVEVHRELIAYFGSEVMSSESLVNKPYLRKRAFSSEKDKSFLEKVFHPRVMEECLALWRETAIKGASRLFVADIPLLFERGIDFGQSANLLVATSRETQRVRLKNRNAWDDDTVAAVLRSQLPIDAKLALADMVFWNEGPEAMLAMQIRRFLESFL